MDPVSIAASVIALLTPFAKKALEEFAGKAGEVVYEKAKSLFEKLRVKLGGDALARGTLERFEKDPGTWGGPLEQVVSEKLLEDPNLTKELSELIQEIEATGPDVSVVIKMKEAKDVVGVEADEMTRGKVRVTQDIEKGERIVGVKVRRLG